MALIFFERVGHEGRRPSPFSWRIRYALEGLISRCGQCDSPMLRLFAR